MTDSPPKPVRMIGLMSGTSADGVDAALVRIAERHGRITVTLDACLFRPFGEALRLEVLDACDRRMSRVDRLCALQSALGSQYASAALEVANMAGVRMGEVDGIACHGQTVWHQPRPLGLAGGEYRATFQLNSPALVAAATGVRVVSDFRSADMAAGGQGAPLVPYADWVLFGHAGETRAVQNIGGIANVTFMPAGGGTADIIAFDTGPGNMVIDEVARTLSGGTMQCDLNGSWAAVGHADVSVVAELIESCPFFAAGPPKSTGREEFGRAYVERTFLTACRARRLPDADIMATATSLTVETIALGYERHLYPAGRPDVVIVGGGGVHNATVMRLLAARLAPARLATHAEYGVPDDAKEAVAFAILGYETLRGRPGNVPSATGASRRVILGSVTPVP